MRTTSTLTELQRLEDALKSGDICEAEFTTRRQAIKEAVEDAVALDEDVPADTASPHEFPCAARMACLIVALLILATLIGAWLLRDLLLALTLSVTGLAALTVRAFKRLGE